MKTATYNDFCANTAHYFNSVADDQDALVVTRDGGVNAVMLSQDEYDALLETLYIMSSPETMAEIRQAKRDLAAGKGIEVNIDEL